MFKHAVLLLWLEALTADAAPLELVDTHAGAGVYDLGGEAAARSGEAAAGIGRVLAAPPAVLAPLAARVRSLNGGREGPLYPGSPVLAAAALRPGDRYLGCELRPDVEAALADALRAHAGRAGVRAVIANGYVWAETAEPGVRRAVLVDPPFEAPDEGARLLSCLAAVLARGDAGLVWVPLKDLDGFDRLLGRVEALRPPAGSAAVQVRLRVLDDPLRLNGCALLLLGGPDVAAPALAVARAVVERCGEPGGRAVLERLGR